MKLNLAAYTPDEIEFDETTRKMKLSWKSPAMSIEVELDYLMSLLAHLPQTVREDFAERMQKKGLIVGASIVASEREPALPEGVVVPWEPKDVSETPHQAMYDRVHTVMRAFTHVLSAEELVDPMIVVCAMVLAYAGIRDEDQILEALHESVDAIEDQLPRLIGAVVSASGPARN